MAGTGARAATPSVASLEKLSQQRAAVLERQELLAQQPRPFDEAAQVVRTLVQQASARVTPPTGYLLHPHREGEAGLADWLRDAARDPKRSVLSPFDLLAAANPQAAETWLTDRLRQDYQPRPKPISAADRAVVATALDAELAEIERAMAAAWWDAVDRGIVMAPPEIAVAALLGVE